MDPYKPLAYPRQFDWYGQCIAAKLLELTKSALKGEISGEVYTTLADQLNCASARLIETGAAACYNSLKANGWPELLAQFEEYHRLLDNIDWYNAELAKHLTTQARK